MILTRSALEALRRVVLTTVVVAGLSLSACSSGLTPAIKRDITFKIEDRRPALVTCYERVLSFNPTLQASVMVAFEVREDTRRFRSIRIKDGERIDPDLERCLITQLSEIELDRAPDVRVETILPVEFSPLAPEFDSFDDDLR